jgi:hypothetical protein
MRSAKATHRKEGSLSAGADALETSEIEGVAHFAITSRGYGIILSVLVMGLSQTLCRGLVDLVQPSGSSFAPTVGWQLRQ